MFCAISAHKAHVNRILVAPPKGFTDPEKRLEGTGKAGMARKKG